MYHLSLHSSVDGHLGCFYGVTIVNSAAMNTGVHVSFQIIISLDMCPGVGLLDHNVNAIFSFLRTSTGGCTDLHPTTVQEGSRTGFVSPSGLDPTQHP